MYELASFYEGSAQLLAALKDGWEPFAVSTQEELDPDDPDTTITWTLIWVRRFSPKIVVDR